MTVASFFTRRGRNRHVIAGGLVALLVGAPGALVVLGSHPAAAGSNPGGKITICHRTDSDHNPYVVESPNKDGVVSGHAGHLGPIWSVGMKAQHVAWGDIIPSFTYNDGNQVKTYPGLNWSAVGQAWLARSCTAPPAPSPTPSPTVSPTPSPTVSPTPSPTVSPTPSPTVSPTVSPTASPTPSGGGGGGGGVSEPSPTGTPAGGGFGGGGVTLPFTGQASDQLVLGGLALVLVGLALLLVPKGRHVR